MPKEGGEILAVFMKDQLQKVEATKKVIDRVNEFRDSIRSGDGLEGVQAQGKKAIDESIRNLQVELEWVEMCWISLG